MVRVNGQLFAIPGTEILQPSELEAMLTPLLNSQQKQIFDTNWELDFSLEFSSVRFRVNYYKQKSHPAASFRLIPARIPTLEEIGLPEVVKKMTDLRQGFILVTGPTGHGKSTTLAAFINTINQSKSAHIVTIEDPIEYVYPAGKSLISQREMYNDTKSWANSLKASLREDPDVVLIGEMRDLDTMSSAMTIAETGHLVFATLHTNSAAQSIDRIIDAFPESQQPQIRLQLSFTMEAILSLRLIPTITPGRTLACEILFASNGVRNIIREGKTHLLDNLIQTSGELGMISLENSLANLVKKGSISAEVAMEYTLKPELLSKLLK